MRARRALPSGGFLVLIGSWVFFVAFLAWGFTRPTLDRAWDLMGRMQQSDFDGLSEVDVALLRSVMERHHEFVETLAGKDEIGLIEPTEGGWSALPVTHLILHGEPTSRRRFWVECRAHERAYPISVSIDGPGLAKRLKFEASGRKSFDLKPKDLPLPIIARVSVTAALPSETGARPFEISFASEVVQSVQVSP